MVDTPGGVASANLTLSGQAQTGACAAGAGSVYLMDFNRSAYESDNVLGWKDAKTNSNGELSHGGVECFFWGRGALAVPNSGTACARGHPPDTTSGPPCPPPHTHHPRPALPPATAFSSVRAWLCLPAGALVGLAFSAGVVSTSSPSDGVSVGVQPEGLASIVLLDEMGGEQAAAPRAARAQGACRRPTRHACTACPDRSQAGLLRRAAGAALGHGLGEQAGRLESGRRARLQ